MKPENDLIKISILIIALFISMPADAGRETYVFDWKNKSEQLTYRSCGCADSCWVAELRERKTKRLKATLRCDCSKLHGIYPENSPEKELANSCSEINDQADKMKAISQKMKSLVEGTSATPCVTIRSGEGLACMKFSTSQIKTATSYGLRLADPFEVFKNRLLTRGWQIDRDFLREESVQAQKNTDMVCGSGWDAMCSTAFKRGKEFIYLNMSGTNDGYPLINVSIRD